MNINKFTIKSQEAIQLSQQLVQSLGQQQIENEHIFKSIFEVDENVGPFILKKLNVNVPLFLQILDSTIQSFPKVSGGEIQLSRMANTTLNEAEILAKKIKAGAYPKIEGVGMLFDSETIDYGTVPANSDGKREFTFVNNGTQPLIITNAAGSCGCTVPDPISP